MSPIGQKENVMKVKLSRDDFVGLPRYALLDPILDLLLAHGNQLATTYRWGSNPTGYFAILRKPIDFDLIERSFEFPTSTVLNKRYGEVDYGEGTVIIRVE